MFVHFAFSPSHLGFCWMFLNSMKMIFRLISAICLSHKNRKTVIQIKIYCVCRQGIYSSYNRINKQILYNNVHTNRKYSIFAFENCLFCQEKILQFCMKEDIQRFNRRQFTTIQAHTHTTSLVNCNPSKMFFVLMFVARRLVTWCYSCSAMP